MIIAYIDPGLASLILQLLVAAFAGGVFYFRRAVGRLFGFSKRKSEGKDDAGETVNK